MLQKIALKHDEPKGLGLSNERILTTAAVILATPSQNQQNGMCAQRRLGSAWASTQSDQSLCCSHEESLGP